MVFRETKQEHLRALFATCRVVLPLAPPPKNPHFNSTPKAYLQLFLRLSKAIEFDSGVLQT